MILRPSFYGVRLDDAAKHPGLLSQVRPQSCVDYTLPQPQLKPSCLNSFNVQMGVTIGSGDKQTRIDVNALPVRRYIRIAFLGDAKTDISLAQKDENTCYPHDAFAVDSLEWQENYDAAKNTLTTDYPEFRTVRGVPEWFGTSCVSNGDGATPGAPDNRDEVMGALDSAGKVPYQVQINGGSGF